MIRINLLPWREKARKQRQRRLAIRLIVPIIALFLALSYGYWRQLTLIDYQQKRNAYLQNQINQVNQGLKEISRLEKVQQALDERMQIVGNLKIRRSQGVRLFNALVDVSPDNLQLTAVIQEDNAITITGFAKSNPAISALMRNIEANPWLSQPELLMVEQRDHPDGLTDVTMNYFSLSMQQVP